MLGDEQLALLEAAHCIDAGSLNLTHVALRLARFVNGVAMKHREVSQGMFPNFPIDAITNGVHAVTWTSAVVSALFDRRIPEWRTDNLYLRYAVGIPLQEIRAAHAEAKTVDDRDDRRAHRRHARSEGVHDRLRAPRHAVQARRSRVHRLRSASRRSRRRSGRCRSSSAARRIPNDNGGKDLIRRIHQAAAALSGSVTVVYVENYEMEIASQIVAGVDLWLNNPMKPLEASGTSGMKAALNGVPSLSVLDGWWIEGHVEGVTGWSIGGLDPEGDQSKDANEIYLKLERVILPLYYGLPFAYAEVMRSAIAFNGSFFNTQRMVEQYVRNAYFPETAPALAELAAE